MRALKAAALTLSLAAAAALAAATAYLLAPGLFLNSRSAAFLFPRLAAEYRPRWKRLSMTARAIGRGRHRYALAASDLCLADARGSFDACFDELELSVTAAFSRRGVRLEDVEQVLALGRAVRVDLDRRIPASGRGSAAPSLKGVRIGRVRVELAAIEAVKGGTTYDGRLKAALDPDARPPLRAAAALRERGKGKAAARGFEALLLSDASPRSAPTFIDADVRADLGPRGKVDAVLRLRRAANGYEGKGRAEFLAKTGTVRRASLSDCRAVLPARPGRAPSEGSLDCRFALSPLRTGQARLDALGRLAGSLTLDGRMRGDAYRVRLSAVFDPLRDWYEAGLKLAAEIEGRRGRPARRLDASAEGTIKAPRFEELVARLKDTKYAVPAPFHTLKGPMTLTASSRGDPRAEELKARLDLTADLAGERQRLALNAGADVLVVRPLEPRRTVSVEADVLIKEAAFELPRLDVARPPRLAYDPRIRTGPAPEELRDAPTARPGRPNVPVSARVAVRTGKPILLFSNLAKDPVPVALDLRLAHPPPSAAGTVGVRSFGVELFRRHAVVDHLNVRVSSRAKDSALEGLIVYKAHDAVINILLLGTAERPRVELTSVPPLKREDILALLIFGKSPADLDPDESASVGNTQTALQSRAFGLASLLLFGATPIERVAYDPATRSVSVKLRLPGGARVQLGSDFDGTRELRLRQPLAPHWAIQSELSEQGAQSRFGTTFLEWFNRY
ncbi:MAG: translocation/assembly module TamB domain-containing protein [Elusimicrobia bacterium]|nr:translocation/assembly module TamB domain-containing protein [Elusimicrobiota bacterium]